MKPCMAHQKFGVGKMPGYRTPADYSEEPLRHPSLIVKSEEPFNAETPRSELLSHYLTPVHSFFKRNHGTVPIIDDITNYRVSITGLIEKPIELSLDNIKRLPKYTITATIQCASNRMNSLGRTENMVEPEKWDIGGIGNAVWVGAKLADVLELVGISKRSEETSLGGKHVEFVGSDSVKEEQGGGGYRSSIPLSHATDPDADVLLAYEMNGEALVRDHGYPLRAVVPGNIGTRSVKWLDKINILAEESKGHFFVYFYKMFPPYVNLSNVDWFSRRPMMQYPVQSAISSLDDVNTLPPGKISIKGYAISGGGRGIERVDISVDDGNTFTEASRSQKEGIKYESDSKTRDKWAWVLFEHETNLQMSTEIIVRAVDSASNVQPEQREHIWNFLGLLNNSWHRVSVKVKDPSGGV